jgi:hypothetical protein
MPDSVMFLTTNSVQTDIDEIADDATTYGALCTSFT